LYYFNCWFTWSDSEKHFENTVRTLRMS
jgi:hypothetical protein